MLFIAAPFSFFGISNGIQYRFLVSFLVVQALAPTAPTPNWFPMCLVYFLDGFSESARSTMSPVAIMPVHCFCMMMLFSAS